MGASFVFPALAYPVFVWQRHRNHNASPAANFSIESLTIDIIVPVFNESQIVVSTLNMLEASIQTAKAKLDGWPWRAQIHVCSDGSQDETVVRARSLSSVVVREFPHRG